MAVTIKKADLRGLEKDFKKLPSKIRKPFRKILRTWGKSVVGEIKNNMTWKTKNMKKSVKQLVISQKRGTLLHSKIGVLKGKGSKTDPSNIKNPGWRMHMYERGWRPFPKGREHGRKGKGWREGMYRIVGNKIYETRFISKVYPRYNELDNLIANAIQEVIRGLHGER